MKPGSTLHAAGGEAGASVHVEVLGEDTISSQARAYAEYRVFAALTQITETEKVRRARVVLRSVNGEGSRDRVACTVTIALDRSNFLRVRTIGAHAYAAINRAVERITTMKRAKNDPRSYLPYSATRQGTTRDRSPSSGQPPPITRESRRQRR